MVNHYYWNRKILFNEKKKCITIAFKDKSFPKNKDKIIIKDFPNGEFNWRVGLALAIEKYYTSYTTISGIYVNSPATMSRKYGCYRRIFTKDDGSFNYESWAKLVVLEWCYWKPEMATKDFIYKWYGRVIK